jgi:peptidoglycan L-alanyl-D-glutamate endopeptidase CwlK
VSARDTDIAHLHPTFRAKHQALLELVQAKGLPIQPFELWRDPNRQAYLFAEGRTPGIGNPGHHVTFEGAWESMHQYGLAADWVWFVNGQWTWDAPIGHSWDEFHALAVQVGLAYLKFEEPHVQMPGISARDVLQGHVSYPQGGDDSWEANISQAIIAWGRGVKVVDGQQNAGAPPLPNARPTMLIPQAV